MQLQRIVTICPQNLPRTLVEFVRFESLRVVSLRISDKLQITVREEAHCWHQYYHLSIDFASFNKLSVNHLILPFLRFSLQVQLLAIVETVVSSPQQLWSTSGESSVVSALLVIKYLSGCVCVWSRDDVSTLVESSWRNFSELEWINFSFKSFATLIFKCFQCGGCCCCCWIAISRLHYRRKNSFPINFILDRPAS